MTANNTFIKPSAEPRRDPWEDWEDDDDNDDAAPTETGVNKEVGAGIGPDDMLIDLLDDFMEKPTASSSTYSSSTRTSSQPLPRYSVQKPLRLKSKGHQKAKIVKAGIKLDTDVSKYRHQARPQQPKPSSSSSGQAVATAAAARDDNSGKFLDMAALKALEGSPNASSIGSFSWLKRKHGSSSRSKSVKKPSGRDAESDLSPVARPIVIGIAVPEDDLNEHQISPQTAVVETPLAMRNYLSRPAAQKPNETTTFEHQRSVWSPDTEASNESPYSGRPVSSIYSQPSIYGAMAGPSSNVPPVPAIPATIKFKQSQTVSEADEDEVGTPCTLFEEDGSPQATRKSFKPRDTTVSPQDSTTDPKTNGWWDHVTTPFLQTQHTNPFRESPPRPTVPSSSSQVLRQQSTASSSSSPQEWWQGLDEKTQTSPSPVFPVLAPLPQQNTAQTYQTSQSSASTIRPVPTGTSEHSEKGRVLLEENHVAAEAPPPYTVSAVKYGAILPPSVVVNRDPLPSPGPISPGIVGTMTSQGAVSIHLAEIPLTPRAVPTAVLPTRAVGTYIPQDHFHEAAGTRHKAERRRRRHEKEEVVARKMGGFWRGRGFISADGCFGRTGREGRKRRRVCLGIFGGILATIILIVVLAVMLTRRSLHSPQDALPQSIWLNLTNFPPMPTGVLTVVGPDNSAAVTGCVTNNAPTAWSCSIPKDQQDPNATYAADQPEFVFQIQFDNNSQALWNTPDDDPEASSEGLQQAPGRRAVAAPSGAAHAAAMIRRASSYDPGFAPNPTPPSTNEIWFLGNTTDGIVSSTKQGEPTPFYLSVISSVNATVGPNVVTRRDNVAIGTEPSNGTTIPSLTSLLAPPALNPDGTGAPAILSPLPFQQPVRLFDRGLPTEHYGFYSYFNKTIYLADRALGADDPTDANGGSPIKDATSLITWSQTRFLVQIWTRMSNTTQLLGINDNAAAAAVGAGQATAAPGTMPYPVTITEDLHGGDPKLKATWFYGVESNQHINTTDVKLLIVDRGFGGTLIDPDGSASRSFGGIDGGTGGCKCEWINFQALTKS